MDDENKGEVDTLIDNEEIVLDLEEYNGDEKTERELKLEEIARNQRIRAEKAEKEAKELRTSQKPVAKKEDTDLSSRDLYALMNAKVAQDDVEEVVKAAKLLGKTVTEALADETVQSILRTREAHRKTAEATNTKTARPGSKSVTDSDILEKASKGEFPDKGSDEAERLFWARRGRGK